MKDRSEQDGERTMAISRRRFLKLGVLAAAGAAVFPALACARARTEGERTLALYNIHTGESLRAAYWARGAYDGAALGEIDYLLRDYRTGEVKPIDPALLNLLYAVCGLLRGGAPFHVVSGYRSPATNAMLAARSAGVAKHSMHMEGKAIDIFLPDRSLKELRRAAWALAGGGVGYYPRANFVHMDVGPVRTW